MNEHYQPEPASTAETSELSNVTSGELEALSNGIGLNLFSLERIGQYDLGPVSLDRLAELSVDDISAHLVEIFDNDRPLSNEMTSLHRVLPTLRASSSHAQKQSAVVRTLIGEFGYGIDRRLLDVLAARLD